MKKLRIFTASPSDTIAERTKVETAAELLKPLADRLEIVIDVDDWSKVVPNMGRPEQVILDQLQPSAWDVFIGILWHRFGTPPAGLDPRSQRKYLSGTEEEFKTAYRLWEQFKKPRIMMYRCVRSIPPDALDPDQFKRVKEFFSQFDAVKGKHPGIYQSFETTESFEKLLVDNLQKLLLDYGEEIRGKPVAPEVVQEFAPKTPDNLPRRAPFFGRDNEMETVLRALSPDDRTWGILLDGIGGIGKTALAVESAYRSKEGALFNAFVFVSAKQNILDPGGIRELTPVARTLDEFFNETTRVIGRSDITKLASDDKRRALLNCMRGMRALLIYDNLETLAKEEQEALTDFLRQLPPGTKAIVTSRRRGGEGAVWLRLERIDWEAAHRIIESDMDRDPHLAAKLKHAGESRWQQLYDETKGSPLALVHTLGLMRVRATLTLDGALEILRGNHDPNLQRFIFREARKELTVNDETALSSLSFFAPSATFEAWAKVANLSRSALETTIDRLSALSLVDVLLGHERYALHPLTRNFVHDDLLFEVTAREIGTRFADYWISYATQYGGSARNYKTYDHLEAEWPNLDAAAEWLWHVADVCGDKVSDKNAAEKLGDLTRWLTQFLWFRGRWDESGQIHTRSYYSMRAVNDSYQAGWNAHYVAWTYYERANTEEAARWADRSAKEWALGDRKNTHATSSRMRGLIARQRHNYDEAEELFQNSLAIWRQLGSTPDVESVLNSLGVLERERERYDDAERYFLEALTIASNETSKHSRASIIGNLGDLELDRKRWNEARRWYDESLILGLEVGRQDVIAAAQFGLALVYEAEGHPGTALPLAEAALNIYERLQASDLAKTREFVLRLKDGINEK